MTREEAKKTLKTLMYYPVGTVPKDKCVDALNMAIEALQADRPRGTWLKVIDQDGILTEYYVCDKCGMLTTDCSNFCPNCGEKMDGERSEE